MDPSLPISNTESDLPISHTEPDLPISNTEPDLLISNTEPDLPISNTEPDLPISKTEPDLPITNNPLLLFFPQADKPILHNSPVQSNKNENIQPKKTSTDPPLSDLEHDQEIQTNRLEKW